VNTPIFDFVRLYAKAGASRLHMPGHKGQGLLGCESLDITEISGADSLYQAAGVIAESEANAAALFGAAATFYSTEGSSLCIRAMLYLALLEAACQGRRPVIVAARNAHQSFILGAALLDCEIVWLWPEEEPFSLCRCPISAAQLARTLNSLATPPAAVYVTSPDYLGGCLDIAALAEVCHNRGFNRGLPLLVDNAHGAYLHFLPQPGHPLDQGADLCCDSAHKTLPVLTGGAYLQVGKAAPALFLTEAKRALALFGSTSPSYLILQSLDLANSYLAEGYRDRLCQCAARVEQLREKLRQGGWVLAPSDPLKLTLSAAASGYTGPQLAGLLRRRQVECEYADPDHLVLMFTPENPERDFARVAGALGQNQAAAPLPRPGLTLPRPLARCSPREALFSASETVGTQAAAGRVLASPTVSCPPAVPVGVGGEVIGPEAIAICHYYGIATLAVLK